MAQRTEWIARFTATSDVSTIDDASGTDEKELEDEAAISAVKVRGALAAFVDSSTNADDAISTGEVVIVITPAADADSTEDTDTASVALLDGSLTASATTVQVDEGSDVAATLNAIIAADTLVRIVVGTERMLVTGASDGASFTTLTVIRGIDATSAAAHSTNAAVNHYVGPEATAIRVDSAGTFAVGNTIKFGSAGTERAKVTAVDSSTNIITVARGVWNTSLASVVADGTSVYRVYNDADIAAAVASAVGNGAAVRLVGGPTWPDFDEADKSVPLVQADYES